MSNLSLPPTMAALLLDAKTCTANLHTIPTPLPTQPTDLLIRVSAIALNPIDSLYILHPLGATGRTIGSDFCGVVVALPSHDSLVPAGTRVAGFLQGACSVNARPGAFAQYLVCPYDLVWRVPDDVVDEQAASVSLCALTASQAIYYRLGLPAPFAWTGQTAFGSSDAEDSTRNDMAINDAFSPPKRKGSITVLINGASTSVALYAAQLLKHSARTSNTTITLIGTASPRNFAFLSSPPYNYSHLLSYRDANWPAEVLALTHGQGVDYAYDCVSEGQTVAQCASTLLCHDGPQAGGGVKLAIVRSKEGGAFDATLLDEQGVQAVYGAVWEGLGEEVEYQGMSVPVSQKARAFAVAFYHWLSEGGNIVANPVRLMPGGFANVVQDGVVLMGGGSMTDRTMDRKEEWMRPISAEKLVYKID